MPKAVTVQFRDVIGEDGYMVSSDGVVYTQWVGRTQNRGEWHPINVFFIDGSTGPRPAVYLRKRKIQYVARIVLEAFRGPCPDGMECCHGDRNPRNNRIDNLRWDTPLANAADRERHGTKAYGERSGNAKLTTEQVLDIREFYRAYNNPLTPSDPKCGCRKIICLKYDIGATHYRRILRGESWAHLD